MVSNDGNFLWTRLGEKGNIMLRKDLENLLSQRGFSLSNLLGHVDDVVVYKDYVLRPKKCINKTTRSLNPKSALLFQNNNPMKAEIEEFCQPHVFGNTSQPNRAVNMQDPTPSQDTGRAKFDTTKLNFDSIVAISLHRSKNVYKVDIAVRLNNQADNNDLMKLGSWDLDDPFWAAILGSDALVILHNLPSIRSHVTSLPDTTRIFDTQLLMDSMSKGCNSTILEFLTEFRVSLEPKLVHIPAVSFLNAYLNWFEKNDISIVEMISKATQLRLQDLTQGPGEKVKFLKVEPNQEFSRGLRIALTNINLLEHHGGSNVLQNYIRDTVTIENSDDVEFQSLLNLFENQPAVRQLLEQNKNGLQDIFMDVECPYYIEANNIKTVLLDENNKEFIVAQRDLDSIAEKVGKFGEDKRGCLTGTLHRISSIRNKEDDLIGLTIRVGRHVSGCADLLLDILFDAKSCLGKSVLLLGIPGTGKTTLMREIAKLLADGLDGTLQKVHIIDTSNEIAGDGNKVHHSVGSARRLMVPRKNEQKDVMLECVKNHSPSIVIIDEIGTKGEVLAAASIKSRGLRMFASAHGTLHELIENPDLNRLIGGIKSMSVGDKNAKQMEDGTIRKTTRERENVPIFDVIIDLNTKDEVNIIMNAQAVVDDILRSNKYVMQTRKIFKISEKENCMLISEKQMTLELE